MPKYLNKEKNKVGVIERNKTSYETLAINYPSYEEVLQKYTQKATTLEELVKGCGDYLKAVQPLVVDTANNYFKIMQFWFWWKQAETKRSGYIKQNQEEEEVN